MHGRVETLKPIEKLLHAPDNSDLYFYLLELWVMNAEMVVIKDQSYLKDLG